MSHFSAARVIKTFFFMTIVFGFYAGLHTTLSLYLTNRVPFDPGWLFWGLGVGSVLCFIIVHGRHNKLTRVLYRVGMLWMGLVFIANLVLLPVWTLSLFGPRVPLWVYLGTVGLLAIGGFLAATLPRVKTITLPIAGLKHPVTLVQISDTHIGEIYTERYLEKIVKLTNKKHPDVVAITGDLFDGGGVLYQGMIDPISKIEAPTLFITGNHEVYEGVYRTTELVKQHKGIVLDDQIKVVAGIQFVGVSYPLDFGDDKHRTIVKLARKVDRSKPIVLLRHEPKRLDDGAFLGADLMLCGHTHNGQVWPLNYLIYFFYDYTVGLHKKDDTWVYISCGAGTWGPPYRIGSSAEIVEFRLVPIRRK